jgi:alpha-beta hydrolase superfamily lysophospholipase
MTRVFRLIRRLVTLMAIAAAAAILTWAFLSRNKPRLQPWHREPSEREWRWAELGSDVTLADYVAREDELFQDIEQRVEAQLDDSQRALANRYFAGSPMHPSNFKGSNWNRTQQLVPKEIRGGALLVHGMSDSPYSMRALARLCEQEGFYALALRMPGHGTVPAALERADWRDWAAAVRLGIRHVQQFVGDGNPIVLVGYSNGSALVLHYAIEALYDQGLSRVDGLVLVSPMIGVTPFAALSRVLPALSAIPYFDRSAWTSVSVEYNPFKYNSFPANGGLQSHLVTQTLDRGLTKLASDGRMRELPPLLTFQSSVDATVLTDAVVTRLYDRLESNGSELVMFDLNRREVLRPVLQPHGLNLFSTLFRDEPRRYRLSVVTNAFTGGDEVAERDTAPMSRETVTRPLGLSWPQAVYSLSHVALPFRPDDPLYGLEPDLREDYGIRLGLIQLRGERGVLSVSEDDLMRLGSNPFFQYVEDRTRHWLNAAVGRKHDPGRALH